MKYKIFVTDAVVDAVKRKNGTDMTETIFLGFTERQKQNLKNGEILKIGKYFYWAEEASSEEQGIEL